jgi:hypothetical protein
MPDSRTARHRRDRIDRAIELASGLTAAGMFAYGVALSYQVLHAIAAGLPPWAAGCGRWASRRSWPHGSAAYKLEARAEGLALAWGIAGLSPSTSCSPWSTPTTAWLPGCTIWAHRSRRSWRRCGVAAFACPRSSRPPTGRGVASTASRSTRRSCSR